MRFGFRSSTYANVTATAALVLALGGTGYAAGSMVHSTARGAGSLPTSLAHGQTETGVWGQSANPPGATIQTDTISYPIPLAKPASVVVRQQGAGKSKNCPGSVKSPKAKAGFLCIYVGAGDNEGNVATYSPLDGQGHGDYHRGAIVYWTPLTADFVYASGSWAVTAK